MSTSALDPESQLWTFNRLMADLLRGTMSRNAFQRWEVDLILDIQRCMQRAGRRRETLIRYQKAVQRHLENGGKELFTFSEYLDTQRQARRKPTST